MSPVSRRSLVPFLLGAAILFVSINAWFAIRSLHTLVLSENWVQHTWKVIAQVERIMGSVKDGETSVRGFVITNNEAYLEPFDEALHELPRQLDELDALTRDNVFDRDQIAQLRTLVDMRLSTLNDVIQARRHNPELLQEYIASGTGRRQMQQMRATADLIDGEEQRLLNLRVAATLRAQHEAYSAVILASALDVLLLILMFRYFLVERGLRVSSELAAENLRIARNEAEQHAAEVRALNSSLEERVRERTAELESTNRELEAFSYSVSHDLRAPLRTIDGFSLALAEDYASAVDDTGRDYIARVRAGVQRMGQLIDALLQLSRITRAETVREPVDISALASSVAADLQETAVLSGSPALVVHIEPGLHAEADAKLLRVALENLLGNAAKFSSKKPDPEISFGWDAAEQAFFIRDNGAGFDMHYASKLFNAFNRLHGDKDFKGSGIGLATVARVIRRHGGRIWAHGVVDHGATFWFTLR